MNVLEISQIQPILTVSQIVSSIKRSLIDLCESLKPFNSFHVQQIYNQQNASHAKIDLPI